MTDRLDAIGRPVAACEPEPPFLSDSERNAIHASNATTAALCMATSDPYRALAGAMGQLATLQLNLRRGKGRPSPEEEQAVAPPHREKRARRK